MTAGEFRVIDVRMMRNRLIGTWRPHSWDLVHGCVSDN